MTNTIDIIGEDAYIDGLIMGTISGVVVDDTITRIGEYGLHGCSLVTKIFFPNVAGIRNGGCEHCSSLEYADFSALTHLDFYAFANCSSLRALVLRNDVLCLYAGSSVLPGTPIESGNGYIYVRRSLIESYKSATGWSAYADQFRVLEDYTVDGTVTGELDETKI